MNEHTFGHGSIKSPIHRRIRKLLRPKIKAGVPFDWVKGYDVEDTIGKVAIKNQFQSDSCGGQAGAYFLEVERRLQGIKEGAISAKSLYAPIAYPGGGTTVGALETQIGAHGAELEATVPSYYATGGTDEFLMTETSWETPQTATDALTRAGYLPVSVPVDMDSVANAIQNYGGVIMVIQGQNNGTWLSPNPLPPTRRNTNEIWEHFLCCKSAKNNKIGAFQSWGDAAGDHGVQYFDKAYFDSGYIVDCFTFIYGKNVIPKKDNDSIWGSVITWFRLNWGLSNFA